MRQNTNRNLVLAALFIALGIFLPFITGGIPQIGSMLLPMHIPVFLCALICGWKYGFVVGLILPLLRHVLFQMPPFPIALAMTFELATYGLVAGLFFPKLRLSLLQSVIVSLLSAMLVGRIVWGIASLVIFSARGAAFTLPMFIAGSLTGSIPGIILQIILIPSLLLILEKRGVQTARKKLV